MRSTYAIIFILLIIALGVCAVIAKRSRKAIGTSVAFLTGSLLLPVIGHLIIISSTSELPAMIGYYFYFLGMDFVVYSLLRFTFDYCVFSWPSKKLRNIVYGILCADALHYLFNPFFRQAFSTEPLMVEGAPY